MINIANVDIIEEATDSLNQLLKICKISKLIVSSYDIELQCNEWFLTSSLAIDYLKHNGWIETWTGTNYEYNLYNYEKV